MGIVLVACLAASAALVPPAATMTSTFERDQLGGERGEPFGLALGRSDLGHDVAALDVAEIV